MKASQLLIAGAFTITSAFLSCTFTITAQAAQPAAPTRAAMTAAITGYLAQHGDLCIGRFNWPIDVPVAEFEAQGDTRNTVQMPTLENAGLVTSHLTTVERREGEEGAQQVKQVPVRRYELTEAGRKFYLKKNMVSGGPAGEPVTHPGDFCAGKLTLDKVMSWEQPSVKGNHQETIVSYTYHIVPAEWARDEDLQGAFPMIARVVQGDRSMQLQQRFRRVGNRWVPVAAWEP